MEYNFSNKVSGLKPSAIREILKHSSNPNIISFAAGNPAPESFPIVEMQKIANDIFENKGTMALQYGVTEGYGPLRDKLKQRLSEAFNMNNEDDDLIIVSGGQQAIDFSTKALCNEGDIVLCEAPSFVGALNAFKAYNTKLVSIPMESDGMDVAQLENTLKTQKNVKMLYIIPSFQNPLGTCTSLEKRKQIYDVCKKYGCIILEDNPYGELRFTGEDIPTIKSMDTHGLVIYAGSMSKVMSAGIRIGFVLANKAIISKLVVIKQTSDVHTNLFFQILINDFMEQYSFEDHIEKIRKIYDRKANLMLSGIKKHFPPSVKHTTPEGGLFLWCDLPESVDMLSFVSFALTKGVAVVPGNAFSVDDEEKCSSFRMNYSTPTDENIEKGIKILGDALKEYIGE